MDLASEQCLPDGPGRPPLTRREVFDLLHEVPGWSLEGGYLVRRFDCKTIPASLEFVTDLIDLAGREGHYPDISIQRERLVEVAWYTYPSGGLTRNDFIMAARLNDRISFRQGGAL
ncbi:pterin-4-alpha-carbinolamine dehydratase [hydrocarbon metagenome]|uniref:4a-hydroxytetrahydrobiopterin dehydratase n=1 Tax=hydrocarbon metagenome TaxID=938273 RepID=A0A0W8FIB3_9ZZZZ|nr:4a-hydroxytetrahydrobiopterin dehydratase [Methanomicrobiaceae archaeon]